MTSRILWALLLSGLFVTQAAAQSQISMDVLEEKFSSHIRTKMPGWTHRRVQPMLNSPNVLIEVWSFPNRSVKISVVPYKSAQQAREVLQGFLKYEPNREEVKALGDEAYARGVMRSHLVFRRGKFLVYVEAGADIDAEPNMARLSAPERIEREKNEVKKLSKEFAKHLVAAIDDER